MADIHEIRIDPTLYTGRPADPSGRSANEIAVYDFLDSIGVSYQRLDHDATPSIEFCEEVEKLLGIEICKNLFLCNRQKTQFYLLLMPGRKVFHTKDLTGQLGCSRLSFADGGKMQEYLGATPGSASVLGLLFDPEKRVRLVIDRDVIGHDSFGCHPCMNTSSLRISMRDMLEKVFPALGHEITYVTL